MPKKPIEDIFYYSFLKMLMAILMKLPRTTSGHLGDFLGRIAFILSRKKRSIAYINMKSALGEKFNEKERIQILKKQYRHFGRFLTEVLTFGKLTKEDIDADFHIDGYEKFDKVVKDPKGCVLLTAHYGNWEMLQVVSGILGTPIHVLGRGQRHEKLNEFLFEQRQVHGSVAIERGLNLKFLIKALREGKLVGVLGDLSAGRHDGVILPFFGRKTTVPNGIFELAKKTESKVLPCFMHRKNEIKHDIHVEDPIGQEEDGSLNVEKAIEEYLEILEKYISEHPEQWLWQNKRWKYSWTRRIVILSDGKPGHFKQSETISNFLNSFTEYHGREGLEFETSTIHVKYRSEFHRKLLFISAFILKPWIQGRLSLLNFFFEDSTVEELKKQSADFILATGSSLAPIQYLFSRETGAKKIVVMKPPFPYSLTHYNLAIVPAHDEGIKPIKTLDAFILPSGFYQNGKVSMENDFISELKNKEDVKISVFLGGDAHDCKYTVSAIEKLISHLDKVSEKIGDYIITTSRRTPQHIERFLKSQKERHPRFQKLIIANEDERNYVVPSMLQLADILIVAEDSLAMISEAIGTGKKTFILSFDQSGLPDKHLRFHELLEKRGLSQKVIIENLGTVISNPDLESFDSPIEKERELFMGALQKLL